MKFWDSIVKDVSFPMLNSKFDLSSHFRNIFEMESDLNGDVWVVGIDIELSCGVNIAETILNFGLGR